MGFKSSNFFAHPPLLLRGAVVARLQRTREVQGSIPGQTTRIKKMIVGDFNLAFS